MNSGREIPIELVVSGDDARVHWRGERQNDGRRGDISIPARGQIKDGQPAEQIARRMDFCRRTTALGQSSGSAPPFPVGGTTMSFDRGRFERQRNGILAKSGQRFKDCTPSSAPGSTIEAIANGRVQAVFTRTIALSRTRLQHVNDSADDAPIVVTLRSRRSRRQIRFDVRLLPVIWPEQTLTYSLAL